MFKNFLKWKNWKKTLAGTLCAVMVLSNASYLTVSAEETLSGGDLVTAVETPVVSDGDGTDESVVSDGDAQIQVSQGDAEIIMSAVPMVLTMTQPLATDEGSYVLSADDFLAGDITATTNCGTNNYFTLNADAENKFTVDSNSKKFTVGDSEVSVSNRIKTLNVANTDKRNIAFTVAEGKTADVTVCVLSSNGSTGTEIALYKDGNAVKTESLEGSSSYSQPITPVTWTDIGSGEFYIGNTGKSSLKAANFYYIIVKESDAVVLPTPQTAVLSADDFLAGDITATTNCGTNNYFTLNADAENKFTVDSNSKKFTVGDSEVSVSNRIKTLNVANTDKRNIAFTVAEGLTADVTVCVLSSNGSTGTEIALYKDGNAVKTESLEGSSSYSQPITPVTWTDIGSGEFYIGNTGNSSLKAANFYYVVVAEAVAGAKVAAPVVTNVSVNEIGGTVTVSVSGTAGATGSEYVLEAKNGAEGTWARVGTADGAAASAVVTVDLSGEKYGTGEWYFRAYGIGAGSEDSASVEADSAVTYVLPLEKAVPVSAVSDGAVTITWSKVREASSYTVYLYDSEDAATAVQQKQVDGVADLEATFTELTNNRKYWVAVQTDRTSPMATTVSDKIYFRPYKPVDDSAAVPGVELVNQNPEDFAMIVLRDKGDITISQTASSGGVASKNRTNMSFVKYPQAVSGDFSISADVTVQNIYGAGSSRGVFLGAYTGTEDTLKLATAAMRGDNSVKAYRVKANGGDGSATDMADDAENKISKWTVGKTYTLKVERATVGEDVVYTISIVDGKNTYRKAYSKSADSTSNIDVDLFGAVYPAIGICGVSVDLKNIVVTVDGTEQFNSANLTGSFSPFANEWADADTPVITGVKVDNEKQEITVSAEGEVGVTGAGQIAVKMLDANGEEVDSDSAATFGVTKHEFVFKPKASGIYSFIATASRPGEAAEKTSAAKTATEFVLKLSGTDVTASNQGAGDVKINWNAVKEATSYNVYYKTGSDSYTLAKESVTDLYAVITGLTIGQKYTFKVMPVRDGEEGKVESTVERTVQDIFEPDWYFAAFGGSSIKEGANSYSGNANDGSVTVKSSTDGGGKIVPADIDQIAFYYTKVPADKNFTLTAKANVNGWTYTNGQEGFGLAALDAVGEHENKAAFWNNSYMAFASKVEYYWDAEKQAVSDAGEKISMKMGLGSQEKVGVTPENLPELSGPDQSEAMKEYFSASIRPLEWSCGEKGSGTYNIVGNATNATGTVENPLTEITFTIQKNNTGYFVSYTDASGNVTTNKYYDTEALEHLDEDNVYVGMFSSRGGDITFTDVSLTLINPEDDAAAEERPVTLVTPSYKVISATNANSNVYELVFIANADGLVTIEDADGTALVADKAVTSGVKVCVPVNVQIGWNDFKITFTPDADYKPSEYEALSSYETAVITHSVDYKTYGKTGDTLYVAPNGSSNGTGAKDSPLDIYTAVKYVQAGQYIVLRGGTYSLNRTITVQRGIDGTADKMIYMIADPEDTERPVFDFNKVCAGMIFAGDYWYCQGFDVTNSSNGQKGLQISGDNSVFDDIHAYHNGNTGIQVSRWLSSDNWEDWPSNDLILNCTAYGNADAGYEDADGFAAKLTVGDGIVFDGCVAYNNADDGWDLFAKPETGPIGQVIIRNCVTYANGFLEDGTNAGNGNGFKMGGSGIRGNHKLINSIAFDNKAKGIDSNSGPNIQVENCTTFNNGSYNIALYTYGTASTDYKAEGVLSYRTKNLTVEENLVPNAPQSMEDILDGSNYFWNVTKGASENESGAVVASDWFESLTFTGVARNEDGTINMNGFLELTAAAAADAGARMAGTASKEIIPGVTGSEDKNDSSASGSNSSSADTTVDWNEVETEVKNTSAGQNTNLNFASTGETKVPTAVLNEIKGENVTVAFQSGNGVALSISGQKLQGVDTNKLQSVDLTVIHEPNVIPDLAVASKAAVAKRELSITDTGSFGVAVDMHINVGKENAGKVANLYRYNHNSGKLEFCSHFVITAEGQSMFAIGRGGDYLITVTNTTVNETTWYFGGDYTVQAGDNLSAIAVRYHMPLAELVRRNPQLTNLNMIKPGQKLKLK